MIQLYHGSNVKIESIDLSLSRKGKDFGCGFYLNPNRQQAMYMAIRTAKRRMEGKPVISTFLFDDELARKDSSLAIKLFEDYSEEWANFILENRNNLTDKAAHSYDIVIGPIANDTVGLQMSRFMQGYISIERMIEELRFRGTPTTQYLFASEKAITYLKRLEDER